MFIGTCNCDPRTLSMWRRGLLCTGGAGFVTALIGTLAGSSRTAQAQELASKPPEVDSVPVRIVTDNQINPDYLIPGHCAGERFYDLVRVEMPDKVIHAAVGARFIFGA
jgi:hypothetical protein